MNSEARGTAGAAGIASAVDEVAGRRFLVVVWRRKWVVLATLIALTAFAALVSKSLPKEYEATATLWVVEGQATGSFDAVQAGQVLAGTYAQVADNAAVAERVADELPFEISGDEVEEKTSFAPVSETQLLEVSATADDPDVARDVANTYAEVFIDYAKNDLGDQVNASITFAAPAVSPAGASKPKPALYTFGGALLGLIFGVAMAFLFEVLDRRIRSSEELEEIVEAPVLGRLPKRTPKVDAENLFDETVRMLRTNLQFLEQGTRPLSSIVVASHSVGDGKSTVSYSLARSFAEAEVSTILIEGDMRRPGLRGGIALQRSQGKDGLSDYLARKVGISAVLQETDLPQLQFMPSGVIPPTPSALFNADRAKRLLSDASEHAEMVIVDTPPLSVGAEANTLAAIADGVLLVVDPHKTTKPALRGSRQQLRVVKANLVGVVLNAVRHVPGMGAYGYQNQEQSRSNGGRWAARRRSRERQPPPLN